MTRASFFVDFTRMRLIIVPSTAFRRCGDAPWSRSPKTMPMTRSRPTIFRRCWRWSAMGARSTAFDKIISATHDHFWDPLDKKYIDFDTAVRHRQRCRSCRTNCFPFLQTKLGEQLTPEQKILLRQPIRALVALFDPAWRAGRAGAVGLALPHPARSGRAGICRQPDARRGPPRHRLFGLHPSALGHAAACGPDAVQPADRNGAGAGGLQKDRRHADAGRRPRHGRLRHAVSEIR